jgi:uncharacterized membrane protein YpjA
MKKLFRELGFAFFAWLTPLVVSIGLYPLKRAHSPLFDSLMGVVLVLNTCLLACLYFRTAGQRFVRAGIRIGIFWTLANWACDALMFSGGPMKMSFERYVTEIGAGYLMIPVISISIGAVAKMALRQASANGYRVES